MRPQFVACGTSAVRKRDRDTIKFEHVRALAARVCCVDVKASDAIIFGNALNELPQKRQLALA
ncbi:hypothetical protein [Achromobacter aegrifaciens]